MGDNNIGDKGIILDSSLEGKNGENPLVDPIFKVEDIFSKNPIENIGLAALKGCGVGSFYEINASDIDLNKSVSLNPDEPRKRNNPRSIG